MARSHLRSGLRSAWAHCQAGSRTLATAPSAEALASELSSACSAATAGGGHLNLVFLGAPGVGKGTYASRVAKLMGVPHVSCGDLVRDEIKAGTPLAKQVCPTDQLTGAHHTAHAVPDCACLRSHTLR